MLVDRLHQSDMREGVPQSLSDIFFNSHPAQVPPQLVGAFEFCAHIKMPGFGTLMPPKRRSQYRKHKHRQTLGGLHEDEHEDSDGDDVGDDTDRAGIRNREEFGETRSHQQLSRSQSLSERPRTPDAMFQDVAKNGRGQGRGVQRSLSGTELIFEAHRVTKQAREEQEAEEKVH